MLLLLHADRRTGKLRTGRYKLAKMTGFKGSTVYKVLQRLVKEDMIQIETNSSYTEITVVNWPKYQFLEQKSVTTQEQAGNNPGNNQDNSIPINKMEESNNSSNKSRIGQVAGGNTIQEGKEEDINNKPSISSEGSPVIDKDLELKQKLARVMRIVNPREKIVNARITLMRARLKEYSIEEIEAAARELAKSKWHKENGQMSVDNLLRPSKFGNWYQKSQGTKNHFIQGSSHVKSSNVPADKPLTEAQIERGKLIKDLIKVGGRMSDTIGLDNKSLRQLIESKQ